MRLINRLSFIKSISERRVVSKPQSGSRLRFVNIIKPSDETEEERSYRLKYESLQDWNNRYWSQNNKLFDHEKDKFIESQNLTKDGQALSHDQLAGFYRTFLERNRRKHVAYNRIWYKNHVALLVSSIRAKLSRLKIVASKT